MVEALTHVTAITEPSSKESSGTNTVGVFLQSPQWEEQGQVCGKRAGKWQVVLGLDSCLNSGADSEQ